MKLVTAGSLARVAGTAVLALGFAATMAGQTTTKTEVKVKDGKDVKVVGCVERTANGRLMLTQVADKKEALPNYWLVGDKDLTKDVGRLMEVSGKASDRGDAKVEVKRETKTEVEDGPDRKVESTTEMHGDMPNMKYLQVDSVKTIAAACR
ncbi:MAG TPA: hypothetical protein VH583_20605 [Vicinamibacterales bacterium]|jgi:hypothetical protein